MSFEFSNKCREFLDSSKLPITLDSCLEEKLLTSAIGYQDKFEIVEHDLKCACDIQPYEDLWIIPHRHTVSRSMIYKDLTEDESLAESYKKCMKMPLTSSVSEVFMEFWRWCTPCNYSLEIEDNIPEEIEWHLESEQTLWLKHTDTPNCIVKALPPCIYELLTRDIFEYGASVVCIIRPCKEGDVVKRNLLPMERSLTRVARLVTVIGDREERWFNQSEREGLIKILECASLPTVETPKAIKAIVEEKHDEAPLLAMTEFAPEKYKVFTDYPFIGAYLSDSQFELVEDFESCDILFAANPIASLQIMAHRMVNQFPREISLLNMRSLQLIMKSRFHKNEEGAYKFPNWCLTTFDLKNEFYQFLMEHKKYTDNMWMLKRELGSMDWCITNDSITVAKYLESFNAKWIAQKMPKPPVLINGKVFILCAMVLVKSFLPMEAYFYKNTFGYMAEKEFTLDVQYLADADVHMPYINIENGVPFSKVLELMKDYEYDWNKIQKHIMDAIYNILSFVKHKIGRAQRNRAIYRFDVLLSNTSENEFKIVDIGFAPDINIILDEDPEFVNDMFRLLFLDENIPQSMILIKPIPVALS